jgi:lipoprotein-anchoring transpeptidase ErfK/SrfK
MKLTLDVKAIQYNPKPVAPLYDPQKTSFTCSTAKAITWTVNGTDPAFCVSAFSGTPQDSNDSKPK